MHPILFFFFWLLCVECTEDEKNLSYHMCGSSETNMLIGPYLSSVSNKCFKCN